RVGEDDGGAKTLLYTVSLGPATLDCRLWYEPKTLKLLKRTMKIRNGESVEGSLTESYVEYIVNADIPNEKFNLQAGEEPSAIVGALGYFDFRPPPPSGPDEPKSSCLAVTVSDQCQI